MIILNEKKYAEDLLKHGFSYFMSLRDLSILAKYYFYLGCSKKQIENNLIDYCNKFNPSFNDIISSWVIKKSLSISGKYNLRIPIEINIYQDELNTISNLNNYKYEKILFVMLICAKNEKINKTRIKEKENRKSKYENEYYVNSSFIEILKLAKVYVNRDERNKILFELNNLGLIQATHSGSFKINYVDETNKNGILLKVMSDENMINSYANWKIFVCSNCHCVLEKKSNHHNLCENCYKEYRKESIRNNVKNFRNKEKDTN